MISTPEDLARRHLLVIDAVREAYDQIRAELAASVKAYDEPTCDACDRPEDMRRHATRVCAAKTHGAEKALAQFADRIPK